MARPISLIRPEGGFHKISGTVKHQDKNEGESQMKVKKTLVWMTAIAMVFGLFIGAFPMISYGDDSVDQETDHEHLWNSKYTVDILPTCTEAGQYSLHCSVCDSIKEGSSRTIPNTGHTYSGWTLTKEPTYTEEGTRERVCTVCGYQEQIKIPVLRITGWQYEDGYWYFYNDDGTKAVSVWRRDSKDWCYLGADGRMVTNGWARDTRDWCWVGGDGYMVKETKWIKTDDDWYHITDGYRDRGKWVKDSKGWCYVGWDYKMVTNCWKNDSIGRCWMGADGYWIANKWIQYEDQWYYIKPNHYMAANEWARDSIGWMYMDFNGRITKNKWVESGDYWYYVKPNGYMATGTQTILGNTYKFDSSGRWIS